MRMITGAAALLLGLLAAGCNGEVVGGGQRPSAVLVVSGDLQTGTVGQELPQPLVVRVVDEKDRPVAGQIVSFVVTAGGGSVFAGAARTNRDGVAQERWTLGLVAGDTQQVEARAVDTETGAPIVFATFRAVGRAAAPTQIVAENPDRTGVAGTTLGAPLVVRVTDAHGNGVPGTAITWTVAAGGGTVQGGATTDATGRAQATWTLGPVVGTPQVAQAAAAGLAPVQFRAMAAPAAPLELVQVSGEYQGAGAGQALEHPLVLQLRQAGGGAPVPGVWVHGGPGMSPDSALTDAQGRASFTWTLPASTGWVEEFFGVPGTSVTARVTAYSSAVVPAQLQLADPLIPYWYPNADLRLSILVKDAAGNPVPLFPLRGTVEAGGGTFTGIAAISGSGSPLWRTGPQEGLQRVRIEAGPADLVVEKDIRRVWLWPLLPANSTVTSGTLLRVRGSHFKTPPEGDPGPGDPRMFVTVDGRTTELRTVRVPAQGYYPWQPHPTMAGWVEGLTPGAKVARFRLETADGTFEVDWPFVYQP
jgi:hypothetical protein